MLTRKILCGVLFTLLTVLYYPAAVQAQPEITAEAGLVMDMRNGQVLFAKNADEHRMYPASTTKILTSLIAIKNCSLDELVTVSENAVLPGGSAVGLQPGEQLTVRDLLYAVMLSSGNDGATALAEHIAGSVDGFAALMNKEARNLGANQSNFTNPHGMPDPNHYTTARDLAVIARAAMQNPTFEKIAGTYHHRIERHLPKPVDGIPQVDFVNHNRMVWPNSMFSYEGATGVKTGYTVDAGQCIVVSARRGEREMLAVVLKSQGYNIYSDAKTLLDYGFSAYSPVDLVKSGVKVTSVEVDGGKEKNVTAVAGKSFYYNFPVGANINVTRKIEKNDNKKAPVYREDNVGSIIFYEDGREIGKVNLLAYNTVEARSFFHWWYFPLAMAAIALAFLILRVKIAINRRRIIRRSRTSGAIR